MSPSLIRRILASLVASIATVGSSFADDAPPATPQRVSVFGNWTTARAGINLERMATGPGQPEIRYPIPAFTFESDRGVFADSEDGVGAAFAKAGPCAAVAALGYTWGVPHRYRAPGLPTIPGSVDARLSLGCSGAAGDVGITLIDELGGTRGRTWAVTWSSPEWKVPGTGERLALDVEPYALYGDLRRTRAWFGVTPEASAASGLPVYDPPAGWMQFAVRVDGTVRLARHVDLVLGLEAGRLADRYESSPVVVRGWQVGTRIGLAYRWR